MPVVYREPKPEPKHKCKLPTTTKRVQYKSVDIPTERAGTIYACDICNKYYESRDETFLFHERWARVLPWSRRAKKNLRAIS